MANPTLIIGDKNLSSWSLRPWLALKHAGVAFDEKQVLLNRPAFRPALKALSPHSADKVPVLLHGDVEIWESLAICEYAAETWSQALWPSDKAARALARTVSNEMHAGFSALRMSCRMNMTGHKPGTVLAADASADLARIQELWRLCRGRFGQGGPFLFGAFSIADAMYAPVVTRITTYDLAVDDVARAYVDAVWALPGMQEWKEGALLEARA